MTPKALSRIDVRNELPVPTDRSKVPLAPMDKNQNIRDASLTSVAGMCEEEARRTLAVLRWPRTKGYPVCPNCGHDAYVLNVRPRFRCKRCASDFSVTSGTIFSGSKVSAKDLLFAACLFVGGAKGVSSLQLSRYLGRQYKTCFVLSHKMREAMQREDLGLSGVVQVDGCVIGGHRVAENTRDEFGRRRYRKKYKNRRVVVVAREPFGNTKAFVGKKESDSLVAVSRAVTPNSCIHADGARAWNRFSLLYKMLG